MTVISFDYSLSCFTLIGGHVLPDILTDQKGTHHEPYTVRFQGETKKTE